MLRWAPRPVDLIVAGVLTVGTQVELWLGPDPVISRRGLAICYGIGTAAAAWHRVAPLVAVTVSLTALAVVPGALGVDPANSFGWLVTVLALLVSVGYQARRPVLSLAVAAALVALSIVLEKGFVLADIAFAWLILGGAWLAGHCDRQPHDPGPAGGGAGSAGRAERAVANGGCRHAGAAPDRPRTARPHRTQHQRDDVACQRGPSAVA